MYLTNEIYLCCEMLTCVVIVTTIDQTGCKVVRTVLIMTALYRTKAGKAEFMALQDEEVSACLITLADG